MLDLENGVNEESNMSDTSKKTHILHYHTQISNEATLKVSSAFSHEKLAICIASPLF